MLPLSDEPAGGMKLHLPAAPAMPARASAMARGWAQPLTHARDAPTPVAAQLSFAHDCRSRILMSEFNVILTIPSVPSMPRAMSWLL